MTTEPTRLHPAQEVTIDPADIRWRVGQISKKDAHKGSLLGYIDARTCMEALDHLDENWSAVHGDPIIVGNELIGVPCALTVNGVTRSDVGMPSSQEPIKGAYSDALKRAAVHFGIGRELYELPRIYVKLDDYKKPVAIPTYRNGRWTLPSGAGSVFYDREPDEQPERAPKARAGGATTAQSKPSPVQRTPEENALLDELMAVPGMTIARASLLADEVGVEKGTHANASQLRAMLERATEQPSSAGAIADGGHGTAEEARASAVSTTPAEQDSSADPATVPPGGQDVPPVPSDPAAPATIATPHDPGVAGPRAGEEEGGLGRTPVAQAERAPQPDRSALTAPEPVSLDDVLAVTGGELIPPKPSTDEYRALPANERASARAYWQKHPEPVQESLAGALGAPEAD